MRTGLFWGSAPDSRHSRNLAERPDVAITVFDSHAPVGGAEALYLEASAGLADDPAVALTVLKQRHRRTTACHAPFREQPTVQVPRSTHDPRHR
ncbi:hypothetical protein AB0K16_53395 [Nonomuraea jabiensis]|uniref:hypothetical protein n=1 Tax=Nonomuraea jabiensis TaxID=882448 RepID=UPI003438E5B7